MGSTVLITCVMGHQAIPTRPSGKASRFRHRSSGPNHFPLCTSRVLVRPKVCPKARAEQTSAEVYPPSASEPLVWPSEVVPREWAIELGQVIVVVRQDVTVGEVVVVPYLISG